MTGLLGIASAAIAFAGLIGGFVADAESLRDLAIYSFAAIAVMGTMIGLSARPERGGAGEALGEPTDASDPASTASPDPSTASSTVARVEPDREHRIPHPAARQPHALRAVPAEIVTHAPPADDATPAIEKPIRSKVVPFSDPFVRHRARVRSIRVLLVSDGMARTLIEAVLKRAGHQVVVCEHADDALCAIAAGSSDAVVLDQRAPDEFLDHARVLDAGGRRTPLIVAADSDAAAFLERGASNVVRRPVEAAALLDALAAAVGVEKPKRAPPASSEALDLGVLAELDELGLGREFVRVFALQCLRDGESCLDRADQAAGTGQWGLLHEECHALKGVASNMGAKRVAAAASELMALPSWRLAREWKQRAPAMRAELRRIAEGLDASLERLGRHEDAGELDDRGAS